MLFWKKGKAKVKQEINPIQSKLYIPDVSQTAKFVTKKKKTEERTLKPKVEVNFGFWPKWLPKNTESIIQRYTKGSNSWRPMTRSERNIATTGTRNAHFLGTM
ncbi:hypothetical protein LPTSP4_15800 [Leptospira ryugenii]|uniref:Uncharacterized protein n=1 Tax=Leptospira ryugenii TaxID=1917863 RepID=A0A2P2DZL0_9LEPT|nr:hypothetical protein LPTSP4_15800 [Leptospira ryugenii]